MGLGYSFTPGLANRFKTAANGPGQLGSTGSQALQVLSLHMPDVLQGHPPAPDDLLRGSGGLTPDTAVRAQTSGIGGLGAPPSGSGVNSPSLSPSPLAIATPAMSALTSQAIAPPTSLLSSMGGSPFSDASDPGPAASAPPGRTTVQLGVDPGALTGSLVGAGGPPPVSTPATPAAPVQSEMPDYSGYSGFSSFFDAILQGLQ